MSLPSSIYNICLSILSCTFFISFYSPCYSFYIAQYPILFIVLYLLPLILGGHGMLFLMGELNFFSIGPSEFSLHPFKYGSSITVCIPQCSFTTIHAFHFLSIHGHLQCLSSIMGCGFDMRGRWPHLGALVHQDWINILSQACPKEYPRTSILLPRCSLFTLFLVPSFSFPL